MEKAMIIQDPRDIEKMSLDQVGDIEAELRGDVIGRAKKYFGYNAEAFNASLPLAKALVALSIAPLNTEQVEFYKASKLRVKKSSPENRTMFLTFSLIFLTGAAFILWGTLKTHFVPDIGSAFLCFLPLVAGGLLISTVAGMVVSEISPEKTYEWSWNTFALDKSKHSYPRYVPVHVLNLAVQLHENLKDQLETSFDLKFEVQELQVKIMDVALPEPDPFLWAVYGPERYCIAVWDEREYEKQL